jgi:hypothetical protein
LFLLLLLLFFLILISKTYCEDFKAGPAKKFALGATEKDRSSYFFALAG